MKIQICSVLAAVILLGCSTQQKFLPPPPEFFEKLDHQNVKKIYLEENWEENERQAIVFSKAEFFKKNKNLHHACQRYRYLSKDKNFPLKDLAFIRAIETCPYPAPILIFKWEGRGKKLPSWLQKEYFEISLEKARKIKNKKYQAHFHYKLSAFKKSKKESEKELILALKIAKKTKDKELIKKFKNYLYEKAPRFKKTSLDSEELFKISRDFENVRRFSKARLGYRKIISDKDANLELKLKSWDRLRLSYKNQRKKKEYIFQTKNKSKWLWSLHKKDSANKEIFDYWIDNRIILARAIWTKGNLKQGRKILKNLLKKEISNPNIKANVYWILGKMDLEKKDTKNALSNFNMAKSFPVSDPDLKKRLHWSIGWTYYKERDYKNAHKSFHAEIKNSDERNHSRRFKFWSAYSLKRANRPHEAESIFQGIAEEDSFDYYGILAHGVLKRPFPEVKIPEKDDYLILPPFEWLISFNEIENAQRYLDSIQHNFKDVEKIKEILPLYHKAQYYDRGISQFFKIDKEKRHTAINEFLDIVYPLSFEKELKMAEQRFSIQTSFLRSIIRQESAFNLYARSFADAFGLMQLTPERARVLSSQHSISYKNHFDLYDPEKNIKLGASLLKNLKHKFKDNFIATVASYNASEKAVKYWFKSRFRGDSLEFIEEIPYRETRNYVKLVLRNYITYNRMSSEGGYSFDLDLLHKF